MDAIQFMVISLMRAFGSHGLVALHRVLTPTEQKVGLRKFLTRLWCRLCILAAESCKQRSPRKRPAAHARRAHAPGMRPAPRRDRQSQAGALTRVSTPPAA